MTSAEVARVFRVDPKTVARWAQNGELPHTRTVGGHLRYPRAEIERLARGEASGGSMAPVHLILVLPEGLDAREIVDGIATAVSKVGDTFADLHAQFTEAAREWRDKDEPLRGEFCGGQARAYRAAADHLAEGISEAFGLWHQHQDQTRPDDAPGDDRQQEAGGA